MRLQIDIGAVLLILLIVCGVWGLSHPARTAELMRDAAGKIDPVPTLKVAAVCELQGQLGEYASDWSALAKAKASDYNSETFVIPPGAISPGAPLRLQASFGTATVTP